MLSTYFLKKAAQYGKRRAALNFSKVLKRQLIAKHVSAKLAGYADGAVGLILSFSSAFRDLGGLIFSILDSRDRRNNDGYLTIWE